MKHFFSFLPLLFLFPSVFSQNNLQDNILSIKKVYSHAQEQRSNFEVLRIKDNSQSSEGAHVTGYKANGIVQIVEKEYLVGNRKKMTSYYYDKQNLVFVVDRNITFIDKSGNLIPSTTENNTIMEEFRYYFKDRELIKYINPLGEAEPITDYHKNYGSKILNQSSELSSKF